MIQNILRLSKSALEYFKLLCATCFCIVELMNVVQIHVINRVVQFKISFEHNITCLKDDISASIVTAATNILES